ncbi:MAG: prenyltransferase/squalene oxidase repeat-containing protein [Planctomycetota bacterium]
MAWLAKQQRPDGSIGTTGTAITSLGAIAFMSAGHLPGRGEYGDVVQRAVDSVISQAQPSGLLAGAGSGGVMYQHGFATLLLGEVYGMTGDDRIQEPLRRAVRLIEQSQNPQGGWRYQPVPVDADVSVTICQVMALRAARDAGIKVERQVIDDAIEYVRQCQNGDGGFNYMLGAGQNSAFPRSAAGVATLYYAGISEGDDVDRGLDYLLDFVPGNRINSRRHHYFYGQYYAAQAMFLAGGDHWATWYPAIREELIKTQHDNGSWSGDHTVEYSTAMALIVLQMPNRYLPVFSGKGPGS